MNHKASMFNQFKKVNVYTKPVTLLLLKEFGHRNYFGVFFTMIVVGVVGLLFYLQIEALILRSNPSVLVTTKYSAEQPQYYITNQNFTITISSLTKDFASYYDLQMYIIGIDNQIETTEQVNLKQCTTFNFEDNSLNDYFIGKNQYCIDWDKHPYLTLEGSLDTKIYKYIYISIKQCDSITSPGCLNRQIEKDKIQIKMTSSYTDAVDHPHPNHLIGRTYKVNIFNSMTKTLDITLQSLQTQTDNGYIVGDEIDQQSLKVSNIQEGSDPFNSATYLDCVISLDHLQLITQKSYPKIQQILSDLGGFWEICYLSCLLFVLPFNNLSYTVELLNELFNFESTFDDEIKVETPSSLKNQNLIQIHPEHTVQLDSNNMNNLHNINQIKDPLRKPSKSQIKLKSIFQKTMMLEKFNRQSKLGTKETEQKNMVLEKISEEITEFFKEQESRLELNFWDYFPCFSCKKGGKRELINYSLSKIKHSLDITYIVKKLQEIDKLKLILLNSDQIKLFDYLPKPKLTMQQEQSESVYCSILKPEQTDLQKALEAQKAFQQLQENLNQPITKKLMTLIDEDLIQLFKIQLDKGVNRSSKKTTTLADAVNLLIKQQNKPETNKNSNSSSSESKSDSDESQSLKSQKKKKQKQKKTK